MRRRCPQQECPRKELAELTRLYCELRRLRKRVAAESACKSPGLQPSGQQQQQQQQQQQEGEPSGRGDVRPELCSAAGKRLKSQRKELAGHAAKLRGLDERYCQYEEETRQIQEEIVQMKGLICRLEQLAAGPQPEGRPAAEEAEWREALAQEACHRQQLLGAIGEAREYFEARKGSGKQEEERRQGERSLRTQLLIEAVDALERHLCVSKCLLQSRHG